MTQSSSKPTYASQHLRMAPVLAKARELDIASNSTAQALFEAGSGGFQIWCTPGDHPDGAWQQVAMIAGTFSKPCEYVASVGWKWGEGDAQECIVGLSLSTSAYALSDQALIPAKDCHNRQDDITWSKKHIHRLFKLAGVPVPPIYVEKD
jgi:hypothetical protein